jgi:hypothetical protein
MNFSERFPALFNTLVTLASPLPAAFYFSRPYSTNGLWHGSAYTHFTKLPRFLLRYYPGLDRPDNVRFVSLPLLSCGLLLSIILCRRCIARRRLLKR